MKCTRCQGTGKVRRSFLGFISWSATCPVCRRRGRGTTGHVIVSERHDHYWSQRDDFAHGHSSSHVTTDRHVDDPRAEESSPPVIVDPFASDGPTTTNTPPSESTGADEISDTTDSSDSSGTTY